MQIVSAKLWVNGRLVKPKITSLDRATRLRLMGKAVGDAGCVITGTERHDDANRRTVFQVHRKKGRGADLWHGLFRWGRRDDGREKFGEVAFFDEGQRFPHLVGDYRLEIRPASAELEEEAYSLAERLRKELCCGVAVAQVAKAGWRRLFLHDNNTVVI